MSPASVPLPYRSGAHAADWASKGVPNRSHAREALRDTALAESAEEALTLLTGRGAEYRALVTDINLRDVKTVGTLQEKPAKSTRLFRSYI
jgi:hypothetical protein